MPNDIGVIVDAYSTGASLARELKARGLELIHIQSMDPILEFDAPSFERFSFSQNIVHKDDQGTLFALSELQPKFIVAGCESGVFLADRLAEVLGLQGNNPATSNLRRDKFEMQEAIRLAGLNNIKTIKTNSVDEAIEFFLTNKYQKVIVKPSNSAGSDGVYSCSTCTEICGVFSKLLNEMNSMGEINSFLIVQEQIEGVQYIVNSISVDGNHSVVDFWAESRRSIPLYGAIGDKEYLIPHFAQGERDRQIIEYVHHCLDAIGLEFGASHTEVFWCTRRNAPVLIEVGARLQGSICENAVALVLGTSQVKVLADLLINPKNYPSRSFLAEEAASHCMAVLMIAQMDAVISDVSPLQEIAELPEFIGGLHLPKLGQKIPKTVSMETCPGVIYLASKDKGSLEKAYQKVRNLELELFGDAPRH